MADPTIRARATSYHDERGGPMIEAALALTTALTLTAGAKPEVLRQALLDAARQHIVIVEAPTTVCRMPILPSDAAVDRRFILKPAPGSPQPKMPSVGKLLPCPLAAGIR